MGMIYPKIIQCNGLAMAIVPIDVVKHRLNSRVHAGCCRETIKSVNANLQKSKDTKQRQQRYKAMQITDHPTMSYLTTRGWTLVLACAAVLVAGAMILPT